MATPLLNTSPPKNDVGLLVQQITAKLNSNGQVLAKADSGWVSFRWTANGKLLIKLHTEI